MKEVSLAFYYFHQGSMVGVLTAGRPDEERKWRMSCSRMW